MATHNSPGHLGVLQNKILVYSDYCNFSQNFASALVEHPDLLKQFVKINIDPDLSTGQRPALFYDVQRAIGYEITEVPTIIVEKGQYVLSGEEAFKWLEYHIRKGQSEDLQAFNPNEMGSFSDNYANLNSDNCASQTFRFLGDPDTPINTPQEDAGTASQQPPQFIKGNIQKSGDIDKRLQELMSERDSIFHKANGGRNMQQVPRIDFTTGKMC